MIKWLLKIWYNRKSIILGWWRWLTFKNKPDWAKRRITICDNCDRKKHGFCMECGCAIPQKCLVEDEKCLINKW